MEKLSISSFKNDSSLGKILHESSLLLAISGATIPVTLARYSYYDSSYYDVIIHPRIVFLKCVLMKNQNRVK